MAQPIKKGSTIKKKGLAAFKEKSGMTISAQNLAVSNSDKPMEWLIMPKAFQEATRLNVPAGYVNLIGGFSDTGKSTIVNHIIVAAQRQGYIPVIYDTENNLDWTYLINMGFQAEPIYGDVEVEVVNPETGEVTLETQNQIIGYDGDFLYYNNSILAEQYGGWDYSSGKETKNKRKEAVLEDIAMSINKLLDAQEKGDIDQGMVFIWDSIGSIGCWKEYSNGKLGNAMWTAAALSQAFSNILNNRIPSSRKQSSPYTNTFVAVNKIWLEPNAIGLPTVRYKGGNSVFYSCHGIIMHVGGQLTSGTKQLKAVSKGATYKYGIESKISIKKSHLPTPWNITYEGPIICTAYGLISKDELGQFQKERVSDMLVQLNEILSKQGQSTTADEVTFIEEEVE